jgi:hypothetical protein
MQPYRFPSEATQVLPTAGEKILGAKFLLGMNSGGHVDG